MLNIPSSMLEHQQNFIRSLVTLISADGRFVGISLSGSGSENKLDRFSDLDIVLAISTTHVTQVMKERKMLAKQMGKLLTCATGEHVNEPRLLICLFDDVEPLHVDLKFVSIEDAHQRVDNPLVLWEVDNVLTNTYQHDEGHYPINPPQWYEDRFWIWIHYGASKIARGELYEAIDLVSFIRQVVIGPIAMANNGFEPNGVRKIENKLPLLAKQLNSTITPREKMPLFNALRTLVEIYISLRQANLSQLELRDAAQQVALSYLQKEEQTTDKKDYK
ncbi:aminoglycoside 6-adenylyltransferase [Aliiglaciecola lipolytica]|uniref:Oxalate/formate antiporter n=1 Tax=Aliiglaciecola lipolytica E3 TaxID=1127673 RepID=K6XXK5_9ALTE|nr:aminoglycoside 6-adenylyltransferase [Aliiglaciecola lipolytica]GAC16366.1 oxalate/formate antiporter [Aliiglaciecola lipolytica E3]